MTNDLHDMIQISCEECATAADEARMEYERGINEMLERDAQESWASLVAIHGPLMTDAAWEQYLVEYGDYLNKAWKD